jgi:hypothetical protein
MSPGTSTEEVFPFMFNVNGIGFNSQKEREFAGKGLKY